VDYECIAPSVDGSGRMIDAETLYSSASFASSCLAIWHVVASLLWLGFDAANFFLFDVFIDFVRTP